MLKFLNKICKRISNLDRLSYMMVIAFGLSFLMETVWWQFGKTTIETPSAIINLDYGVIGETRLWVRILEGGISLGLIILGINRLVRYHKICKCITTMEVSESDPFLK